MSQDDEPDRPEPVRRVVGLIAALISDIDEREAMIELAAAPGAAAFWLSLTEAELEPLHQVIPSLQVPWIRADLARVPLLPLDGSPPSATAEVRYFPELHEWRVVRLGGLGPPQPGRPRFEVLS